MKKPNIIQIVSDDTSLEMLGYGGGKVLTPNIDSIAARGVVFDSFHCPGTVCMVSRYSALTGHYPGRCPAPSMLEEYPTDRPYSIGFNTDLLPGLEKTIAHVLGSAGYRTGYVGKWHTGPAEKKLDLLWFQPDDDPADPEVAAKLRKHQQRLCEQVRGCGFDYAGSISWGNPQPNDRQIRRLEIHHLEWMVKAALAFIDECAAAGRPFHLQFAPTTIHGNGHIESLMEDPRLTPEGYRDDLSGILPPRPTLYERIIDAGLDFNFITAGSLWMDDAIGAILDRLRHHGLEDDTLVTYASDHGACEDKSTLYQGGVRIPCIAQWPRAIRPGRHVTALCSNIDWVPTLAEISGARLPPDMAIDGRSIVPLLLGQTHEVAGREDLYFEFGYSRGVRTARWKYMVYRLPETLIERMKTGQLARACVHNGSTRDVAKCLSVERHPGFFDGDQLYDLAADPGERNNLADDPAYKAVLDEMRGRLRKYLATFKHPFPLDQEQDFLRTDTHRKLTEPYRRMDDLNSLRWWTRKWHHRPHDVLPPSLRPGAKAPLF